MLEQEFEAFLKQSQIKVREKQDILNKTYGINEYDRYHFAQQDRRIILSKAGKPDISFHVVCIGSWGYEDESWVWAWNNENLSVELREAATPLKNLENKTGFGIFNEGSFKCEEIVSKDLAFISVQELGANGIYRIKADESYLYLALFTD